MENIAEKPADEVSIATLLNAKPFKMIHVDGIIQNVSRKHQHELEYSVGFKYQCIGTQSS